MSLEELVNQNYKYFSESDRAVWKKERIGGVPNEIISKCDGQYM